MTEVALGQLKKSVYTCQVMGSRGCGKSSFVRGLIGKGLAPVPEELQVEEAMSIKSLTLPATPGPVYLLVGVACVYVRYVYVLTVCIVCCLDAGESL